MKFGEVVLQPPELTAKPRRSETRDQVWGTRQVEWGAAGCWLLWASFRTSALGVELLGQAWLCRVLSLHLGPPSLPQPGQKSLILRKLLSPSSVSQPLTTSLARQRIVQEERERAVQAYRALKKQQQQGTLPPQLPGHTQRTSGAQP